MRLSKPFYRLPARFDVARLRAEIHALPASAWAAHPNAIAGNSSLRLISVDGLENDDVDGEMRPTPHLAQCPYLRQVLASFGVVWSRSRLLKLAPGAEVPEHADINYHWFNRVRLHIPIETWPEVRFHCGDESVHMAAGEAWIFDNWRLHRVINPAPRERIHLVADTSGTAAFWRFVAQTEDPQLIPTQLMFDAAADATPLTERATLAPVMAPAEVDLLTLDLRAELISTRAEPPSTAQLPHYHALLDAMCRDWRQLYALHGGSGAGHPEFERLRDRVRDGSRAISKGIVMRTNHVSAHAVLEGRILRPMLANRSRAARLRPGPDRPVIIVAAPRSGSTLLFETLAASHGLYTLGGEAHELIEGFAGLRPGAPGVDSNRLMAEHATDEIVQSILERIRLEAHDSGGTPPPAQSSFRLLEKTPKNALRIPFLTRLFPDARFVVLWRDPRENLSSIIEAWRSGRWKTYNGLDGFDGPWSLLLPPGWRSMNRRPLEEIAAFQWSSTYRIVLDDLAGVPRNRWTSLSYAQFLADPETSVRELCRFAEIDFDAGLTERVSKPLPHSRYTLTAPDAEKWRRNQLEIERVLPSVAEIWQRLRTLR